ncbi:MAG: Nif3-like dinuclear metal center hexameric protein [Clostridiales bacterium]|nr:Nif3-like dinuclear metal center hexameric protein [Clostridiales bacterium]
MKMWEFAALMERIAPKELALEFDNQGLLIEPDHSEINRVLVALDCTKAVAEEAAEWGADLVLTHHPLFFHPVKKLAYSDPATAAACVLLRHGIGLFAAHTNLDASHGGVNDTLCAMLGIREAIPFNEGIGRIGQLKEPESLSAFAKRAELILSTHVCVSGDPERMISNVAVMGGSGGSSVVYAATQGADLLLTGELKHSDALDAQMLGVSLVVAGHYETEAVVLEPLMKRLQNDCLGVQYKLSRMDGSPFVRL